MKLSKKLLLLSGVASLSFVGWTFFYCFVTGKMVELAVDRDKTITKSKSAEKISGGIQNEFFDSINTAVVSYIKSIDIKICAGFCHGISYKRRADFLPYW